MAWIQPAITRWEEMKLRWRFAHSQKVSIQLAN